jgi:PilX N-terminal
VKTIRTLVRDESGVALITVLMMVTLLLAVGVALPALTSSEGTRSNNDVRANSALQAAESGLNVYIADMTEDSAFYLDYIAAGEARRTSGGTQYPTTAGANASANVALSPSWGASATWTYPSNITTDPGWRTVGSSAYQYLLEIFPNASNPNEIRIIAVGRPTPTGAAPATDTSDYRAVEAELNSLSISDFQMLSASAISYGSSATTNGWIYATDNDNGTPASISHSGKATADMFTENTLSSYSGNTTIVSPARKYASNSSPSIRTVINEPITFADLRQSNQIAPETGGEGAIQLDAASTGITLTPTTNVPNAFWLKFSAPNKLSVYQCLEYYTGSSTKTYYAVDLDQPNGGTETGNCTIYNSLSNVTLNATTEEIYSTSDVIVSGAVGGQVTVYTAGGAKATEGDDKVATGNIIIGDNISYVTPGSDVLGLVATNSVIIACWEPETNLTWTAATIALNGAWESDPGYNNSCNMSKNNMTFTGSTATYSGGSMGGFNGSHTYNYDPTLRYLPPPDYPEIPSAFKIMYERQIAVPGT